jgi:hypothetical protein
MGLRSRGRRTPPSLITVQVGTPQCEVPDDDTVMAEAKTMYTKLVSGDRLAYYTKERWIGWGDFHGMYFSNWNTALCEALWLAYREWQDEEERLACGSGFASEKAFVVHVVHQLQGDGWRCCQEVRTRYGRMDLLATRDSVCWIIEAKLRMTAADVTCALGQLLCGREAYPDAQLWFATPAPIQPRWQTLLTRYAIHILEGPWTQQRLE